MASNKSLFCHEGFTPPNSPTWVTAASQAVVKDLKHFFGVFLERLLLDFTNEELPNTPVTQDQSAPGLDMVPLKRLLEHASAKLSMETEPHQSCSPSNEEADGLNLESPICTTPGHFERFEKWASKSQYKTVLETYGPLPPFRFRFRDFLTPAVIQTNFAEYAFVVRERLERNAEEVTPNIDIKSEGLRDILRVVLHDIKAISLMEDKPSIEQNILFHFLPELDKYAENMNNPDGEFPLEHPLLLIHHLKQANSATSQRLSAMLQHGHITVKVENRFPLGHTRFVSRPVS
ncbi:hypothetical protein NUU61_003971 [Penicillium alfredii]|uniref:Uncharacterized protein n=1 Tax=Penicillium alfredii TaxID=1506179 RepID=A0A9W9FKF3_9EURO|nr:uncharacterized protein NUU61_003971 [Penicillium alfredii]KAJ5101749.1 hypothetical protein NUU61_003971 [Penicillium alfredii]